MRPVLFFTGVLLGWWVRQELVAIEAKRQFARVLRSPRSGAGEIQAPGGRGQKS